MGRLLAYFLAVALLSGTPASTASAQPGPAGIYAPAAQDLIPEEAREVIARYDNQCEGIFRGIPNNSPDLVKIADVTRDGVADYIVDFTAYECRDAQRPRGLPAPEAGKTLIVYRGILKSPASNRARPDYVTQAYRGIVFASRITMDNGFAVITVALTPGCGRGDAASPLQIDLRWCGRVLNLNHLPDGMPPAPPSTAGERASAAGDFAEAARLWTAAAEQGDARSMVFLANLYGAGQKGVARDEARALAWYRRAAETKIVFTPPPAIFLTQIVAGYVVSAASVRAAYVVSAENDATARELAFLRMALAYEEGLGVGRDKAEAAIWYRRWASLADYPVILEQRIRTLADRNIRQ